MQPGNPNILVLFGLLEIALSQQQRKQQTIQDAASGTPRSSATAEHAAVVQQSNESWSNNFEYCYVANELCQGAQKNALALNQMANHLFFSWIAADHHAIVIASTEIHSHAFTAHSIASGDALLINHHHHNSVKSVEHLVNGVRKIVLAEPLPESASASDRVHLHIKEYDNVRRLAESALENTHLDAIKAESHYILGRLYRKKNDLTAAISNFTRAIQLVPDMPLALFSLGEIRIAQQEYEEAYKLFTAVQARNPDDRDTNAYIILLKSVHLKEITPVQKIRDIITGFPFETDVWQMQGMLRMALKKDLGDALKCLELALDAREEKQLKPVPQLYGNIAVLRHAQGDLKGALESIKDALITYGKLKDSSSPKSVSLILSAHVNHMMASLSLPMLRAMRASRT